MSISTTTRSRSLRLIGLAAATLVTLGVGIPAAASTSTAAQPAAQAAPACSTARPTIVLVHGAWADASSFAPVTSRLQAEGYTVRNAPNPLRSLAGDAANVAAFVNQQIKGPVVLVGHSYGGSVITDAAAQIPTTKSLVYVDAYAPAEGESVLDITAAQPGSVLGVADPTTVFDFVQYPGAPTGDVDAYIKPALFGKFFAAHLPKATTNELASSQSPVTLGALSANSTAPAWAKTPSYFFIGSTDAILPSAEQRVMAQRAHAVSVVELEADHLSMLEQPAAITHLIEGASR